MLNLIKRSRVLQVFILGIIAVIFYREVFSMQFWKDDFSMLHNLQQKIPFFYPYYQLINSYIPLFAMFGTVPFGYFAVGLLTLVFSSVLFYFLVYILFSNKILAFIASVIYITSPVGVDNTFMAETFAATYFLLITFFAALLFLIKYYKEKKILYYVFSIALLALGFEISPYRSFYFIGVVILFELINFQKRKNAIKSFLLRQLSLIAVWTFFIFIRPVYLLPEGVRYMVAQDTPIRLSHMTGYKLLLFPLFTFVNVLWGGIPYLFSHGYFTFDNIYIETALLIPTAFFFLYLYLKFRKKLGYLTKIFLFSLGYIYLTTLSLYVIYAPGVPVETSFRYLLCALPAYSLLVICVYLFLCKLFANKNKVKIIPKLFLAIILLLNVYTTQIFISDFNTRAPFSARFPAQMKELLPRLAKNSIIYFQLSENPDINYRLIDTYRVGTYEPKAYFAVLYNLKMEEVNNPILDFTELYSVIRKDPKKIEKINAFKYDEKGLHNITNDIKRSIAEKLKNGE